MPYGFVVIGVVLATSAGVTAMAHQVRPSTRAKAMLMGLIVAASSGVLSGFAPLDADQSGLSSRAGILLAMVLLQSATIFLMWLCTWLVVAMATRDRGEIG